MSDAEARSFVAACVQMRSGLDWRANFRAVEQMAAEAAGRGATLVATPEMTSVLDRNVGRLAQSASADADARAAYADLARRLGVWLLLGSTAAPTRDGRFANRSALYGPDGVEAATYDKIHMFDVALPNGETWRESAAFVAGERAVLVETPLGVFGFAICYDLRFPALYRTLARAGAKVIFTPAAFTRETGRAHWETLLKARAIECGAFLIAPAQGGEHEDGRSTWGRSMIVGPWGETLAEKNDDEPGVALASIDVGQSDRARRAIPSLQLENSFEIHEFRT